MGQGQFLFIKKNGPKFGPFALMMCYAAEMGTGTINYEYLSLSDTENPNPVLRERLQKEIAAHGNKIAYISSELQDERRRL